MPSQRDRSNNMSPETPGGDTHKTWSTIGQASVADRFFDPFFAAGIAGGLFCCRSLADLRRTFGSHSFGELRVAFHFSAIRGSCLVGDVASLVQSSPPDAQTHPSTRPQHPVCWPGHHTTQARFEKPKVGYQP